MHALPAPGQARPPARAGQKRTTTSDEAAAERARVVVLRRRISFVCVAVACLGLVAAGMVWAKVGRVSAGSGVPVTLLTVRGQIGAFAQDGGRIAWIDAAGGGCGFHNPWIRLRTLATGLQQTLGGADIWGFNVSKTRGSSMHVDPSRSGRHARCLGRV